MRVQRRGRFQPKGPPLEGSKEGKLFSLQALHLGVQRRGRFQSTGPSLEGSKEGGRFSVIFDYCTGGEWYLGQSMYNLNRVRVLVAGTSVLVAGTTGVQLGQSSCACCGPSTFSVS